MSTFKVKITPVKTERELGPKKGNPPLNVYLPKKVDSTSIIMSKGRTDGLKKEVMEWVVCMNATHLKNITNQYDERESGRHVLIDILRIQFCKEGNAINILSVAEGYKCR